jgi:hypothetical protein
METNRDKYTFQQFKDDLRIGLEFDFYYKDQMYSISRGKEGCFLAYDREKAPFVFKNIEELLTKARIEGFKLEDIYLGRGRG